MPFINTKISVGIDEKKEEKLKAEFGKLVSIFGKDEKWVMVAFDQKTDIWFGGDKKEKAAYVSVSLVGDPDEESCKEFTTKVCELYKNELGITGDNIYITFHPVKGTNWGWNNQLF